MLVCSIGCSNLIYASKLLANEIPGAAYQGMFANCTNLLEVPKTSKITLLGGSAMQGMFWGCSKIKYGIDIDAYRSEAYCCTYMYNKCSSLIKTPKLNSVELGSYCYMQMFQECSSLEEAELPNATILELKCCDNMFTWCVNLKSVKVNFINWQYENENYATNDWLRVVANNGTFYKPSSLPKEYGVSYIPSGWTVVNTDID